MFTASILGLVAIPGLASAQQSEVASTPQSSADTIADIVVTAQKRAENVQQVPISVTALGGAALQERSIANIAAVTAITPNVTLDAGTPFSGSTAALGAFIRGIGQNDFAINLDPGVGIYLDGVYLARTVGANVDLPDVERVEVLKGPQGTLFGRNSVGGAISVVTRAPSDKFSFRGSVTTGSFNRLDADGSVDLPISDTVTSLVTFSTKSRDGYVKRVPYPSTGTFVTEPFAFRQTAFDSADREGGDGSQSLRAKIQWKPSTSFKLTLAGDHSHIDQSAIPNAVLGVTPGAGAFAGLAANNIPGTALDPTGVSGFNFAGLYNFCIGATPAAIAERNAQNLCGARGTPLDPVFLAPPLASANVDADPNNNRLPWDSRWITTNPDRSYATGNSFSKMKSYGLSATIDFSIADNLDLRSISGYRHLRFNAGLDVDNSPIQMLEVSQSIKQRQFSQEFQLIGDGFQDKLHYVLGAYYFDEKASEDDFANIAQGLLQINGPLSIRTKNYAFFGQADYRLSDLIGFTLGARYTHEDKEFEAGQLDFNGFNYKLFNCMTYGEPCQSILGFPVAGQPLRYYIADVQKQTFSNFSPKIGVQLHPTSDMMIYGSFSQGYKTGGWTSRLSNPLNTAPSFDPEKATTWEAGIKSSWLNRRLQINLSAFTTRYSGIQLNFQQGVSPTLQNAGTARIKGFELEMTARPLRGLSINTAVGYTDAKYISVEPQSVVVPSVYQAGIFTGSPLAKTPKWKVSVSPRYEFELGDHGSVVMLVDYSRTSSIWNDTERTYLLRRPATDTLGASVMYREPGDHWTVTVGGTNITNDRFVSNGLAQVAGGLIYGAYNRPAEWYARLGVKF
ncbi:MULTISPECIES: TonB-dependent receptor [unclassified Sphingobium]|uniref:TonB-dependent receptor n=1 Tax=unclassified Sphingobium TaxID=2611147 RepID=UPI000D162A67|nr:MULTISPECIES: TonB-dependent receptor [unclassified Sphingobium]PSO09628.1 TonB-dependent receptor [Sphingobium sp. AEW4]